MAEMYNVRPFYDFSNVKISSNVMYTMPPMQKPPIMQDSVNPALTTDKVRYGIYAIAIVSRSLTLIIKSHPLSDSKLCNQCVNAKLKKIFLHNSDAMHFYFIVYSKILFSFVMCVIRA